LRRYRQPEKGARGRSGRLRKCSQFDAAGVCDDARDVREIRRLVAARGRLALEIARQQVRRIGLDHQTRGGYLAHQRLEVRAAPLIADPPGDADCEIEAQQLLELGARAGETVRDSAREGATVLAQDRGEVGVRIALMQEYGLADAARELELALERAALDVARGEITVVIESALAERDDGGMRGEPLELGGKLTVELGGVVRMNTCGGKQLRGMRLGQLDRAPGARAARAGHDHLYHPGGKGPRNDLRAIPVKAVVRQVYADVDEHHVGILSAPIPGLPVSWQNGPMKTQRAWLAAAAAGAAVVNVSGAAQGADAAAASHWLDVESRIQYAYYTEDRRTLESIAASLATDTTPGGERPYYIALASYRLADLADPHRPQQAKEPAERCTASLAEGSDDSPAAAERLVLESACLHMLAGLEPLRGPYLALKSSGALKRALALAPRNPRVLLLHALADRDRRDDPALVARELRQATAAFELEREDVERVPEWGAAEAYAFLGRTLLEQGQTLAARGALEHALLLVPDFVLAHRLMARITAG
jgi:putative intracellular protease/amidase